MPDVLRGSCHACFITTSTHTFFFVSSSPPPPLASPKCVLRNADNIDKGVCQREFEAMRKCFMSTRGKGKK